MKILCAGDLHIGRRPTRLPDRIDCAPLSCATVWSGMVERAIADQVDLVLLSGDLVDESNKYYEAVGPLEAGVRKLAARGIRTVAVAGNHDHDVLPWVREVVPGSDFVLLGRGGAWDRFTLEIDGRPALHVDGWSFPERHHREDPLRGYAPAAAGGVPVVGLLHCDLDLPSSTYAPVAMADLRRQPVAFWLLGHVHARRLDERDGSASVLYPGSPQAMDPGETGPHGAWIVEATAGKFSARPIALASVRYEAVDVDLADAAEVGEVHRRITAAVRGRLGACAAEGCGPLRYLNLRLRLTGRTPVHRALEQIAAEVAGDLELERDGVTAVVERVTVATGPARDLDEVARGQDAPGALARLIRALRSRSLTPDQESLLRAALRAASDVRGAKPYRSLPDAGDLDQVEAEAMLADRSALLLEELLAQKEESP